MRLIGRTRRPVLVPALAILILGLVGGASAVVATRDGERGTAVATRAASPSKAVPTTPPTSPAEECPPPDAPLSSEAPAHCEAHYNAAGAELQRLEASLGGLGNFVTRVRDEFGERYGGKWADTVGSGPGIAIGLVNPTPADQARLRELSGSDRVRFFPVRYSEAQLQRWRDEIMAILKRHRVEGGASTEGPRNRVWLTVDVWPDEAAADVARLGVPADALLIETGWRLRSSPKFLCVPSAGEVPKEPTASGCA